MYLYLTINDFENNEYIKRPLAITLVRHVMKYVQLIVWIQVAKEAIIAFLESTDFEDAIRLAISLGGDADTMGAITGGISEAYYKNIPIGIKQEVIKKLPDEFINVMWHFSRKFNKESYLCLFDSSRV